MRLDDLCREVHEGDDGLREVSLWLWQRHGSGSLTFPSLSLRRSWASPPTNTLQRSDACIGCGMKRWAGSELEAMRREYVGMEQTLVQISARYGTSPGNIMRLARVHGWPRRRPDPISPDLARMKNIRHALRWRIRKMEERLRRVDDRIREMAA